jgi:hypothetical protein
VAFGVDSSSTSPAYIPRVGLQVLTNAAALDRAKQIAVVRRFTDLVAAAADDPSLTERTWVLLAEAPDGGCDLAGHAHTNIDLVPAARAEIAGLSDSADETGWTRP